MKRQSYKFIEETGELVEIDETGAPTATLKTGEGPDRVRQAEEEELRLTHPGTYL